MSLTVQMYLLETYGPRLDVAQIAKALGFAEGTVRNKVSRGELPFVYKDGGSLFANAVDVANYIDSKSPQSEAQP